MSTALLLERDFTVLLSSLIVLYSLAKVVTDKVKFITGVVLRRIDRILVKRAVTRGPESNRQKAFSHQKASTQIVIVSINTTIVVIQRGPEKKLLDLHIMANGLT